MDGLRDSLLELINVCPVEKCNPTDCPLFALRELSRRRRLEWLSALNQADLEYLAVYHYVCMDVRLGTHLPPASPGKGTRPSL
jgi:hypothetical protein